MARPPPPKKINTGFFAEGLFEPNDINTWVKISENYKGKVEETSKFLKKFIKKFKIFSTLLNISYH